MSIDEVTVEQIKQYAIIDHNDDDGLIQDILMPAAKAHILEYTGLSVDELDKHESITLAYIALCSFLYDNRSMNILNEKQNAVVQSFLDAHRINLL